MSRTASGRAEAAGLLAGCRDWAGRGAARVPVRARVFDPARVPDPAGAVLPPFVGAVFRPPFPVRFVIEWLACIPVSQSGSVRRTPRRPWIRAGAPLPRSSSVCRAARSVDRHFRRRSALPQAGPQATRRRATATGTPVNNHSECGGRGWLESYSAVVPRSLRRITGRLDRRENPGFGQPVPSETMSISPFVARPLSRRIRHCVYSRFMVALTKRKVPDRQASAGAASVPPFALRAPGSACGTRAERPDARCSRPGDMSIQEDRPRGGRA